MTNALSGAVKRLLPAPALAQVRTLRWRLRLLTHRLRWLASGRRGDGIGIGSFGGHRVAYRLRSVDAEVLGHSFDRDIFFSAIPEYVLPEDGIVLDVGAHIGTFSVLAAEKARRGRVFAIEASRETFDLLRVNTELSGLANIVTENLALAGEDGVIRLYHDPEGNYGHSITKNLASSSEAVQGVTLTRYLGDRGLTTVDLAKFNCEGAEFPILLSTRPEVLQRIDKMIVLYHCDLVEERPDRLIDHLQASGFHTRRARETAERGWIIATRPQTTQSR